MSSCFRAEEIISSLVCSKAQGWNRRETTKDYKKHWRLISLAFSWHSSFRPWRPNGPEKTVFPHSHRIEWPEDQGYDLKESLRDTSYSGVHLTTVSSISWAVRTTQEGGCGYPFSGERDNGNIANPPLSSPSFLQFHIQDASDPRHYPLGDEKGIL